MEEKTKEIGLKFEDTLDGAKWRDKKSANNHRRNVVNLAVSAKGTQIETDYYL